MIVKTTLVRYVAILLMMAPLLVNARGENAFFAALNDNHKAVLDDVNGAPEITGFTGDNPGLLFWGSTINIQTEAFDPDGDPLTFDAADLPPGLSIDPDTGQISGCLDIERSGGSVNYFSTDVTATDPDGLTDSDTILFSVGQPLVSSFTLIDADTNLPIPGFDPIPSTNSISLNSLGTNLNIRANTGSLPPTCGIAVTFELDGALFRTENVFPFALAGDREGDYFSWTPTVGQHLIEAVVISQEAGVPYYEHIESITINVTLERINEAPMLVGFQGKNPDYWGEEVDIQTVANDPNGDPITYSATGLPPDLSLDPSTGKITGCLSLDSGVGSSTSYSVTVTATDPDGLNSSKTLELFILQPLVTSFTLIDADTDLPVPGYDILDSSNSTIDLSVVGTNLNIRANTDMGPVCGGALKFELDGTPFRTENIFPYALAGDSEGDYFSWTPTVGEHTISAEIVSKATGSSFYGAFSISIKVGDANIPEITGFTGNIPQYWGEEANIQTEASDPEGDPLTYSATDLPPNLSIDSDSGKITGCLDFDIQTGSTSGWNAIITATDPDGLSNSKTLDFGIRYLTELSFTLIDADTDLPIPGYDPMPPYNNTIDLSIVGTKLNIRANTQIGPVCGGAIEFELDDVPFRTENVFPYALAGDREGDYFSWTPTEGEHRITANIFSKTTGEIRLSSTFRFNIISGSSKTINDVLSLYPNPSSDFVQIDLQGLQKDRLNYRVVSIADQRSLLEGFVTENNNTIEVGFLGKGMYIIELASEEGTIRKHLKLLKD